jgi:hydrophobic/amphiphilic exporter-1 (mainly G- bacteria), HAE1 family
LRTIVKWCLENRPVVVLFGLIFIGAGAFSMFRLNQELFPSIDFPSVYLVTQDPGASPETVDRDVSVPLVNGLNGLPHATHIQSQSMQGFSQVQIQFDLNSSSKDDLDAVNQRVGQVQLPQGIGRPLVQTFSFSALPSLTYSLAATDGDLVRATNEAKQVIVPALQGAQGAAQVKVVGGAQDAITIKLDAAKLAAHGLAPYQVSQALSSAQVNLPAGESLSGDRSVPVQVLGNVKTVADVRALVIGSGSGGGGAGAGAGAGSGAPAAARPAPVTLGDVATVEQAPAPVNGISRTDGLPSLSIQVIRNSSDNAVTLSNDVRSRIAGLHLNQADRLTLVSDAADDIKASLNDLILEGLIGAALAILVIFLFLRSFRGTLVTAVSLPTSVLVALLGTSIGGFSLNILTLAGLTIAVGRIVDDAIVVLENSYRHLQQGETPRQAALNGATEVARAVISSTLTTVAVFLPIGVVGGIISKFFLPFSITVTISLLASLLVAMTLVPVLVSLFLQQKSMRTDGQQDLLHRAYRPVLSLALRSWWTKATVLALTAVLFAAAIGAVASPLVPKNFFDFGGSAQLDGQVTLPAGTTTQQTSDRLKQFETFAAADPDVKLNQVTLSSSDYGAYTCAYSTNTARLLVLAKDKHHAQALRDRLQKELDDLYGKGKGQIDVSGYGPTGNSFQATASGSDDTALRQASDAMVARLQTDPDLSNVKSDLAAEKPQLTVAVDPAKAAAHGLDPKTVAQIVAGALSSQPLGNLGGTGPALSLQLDPNAVTVDKLGGLQVGPGTALRDVATLSNETAPDSITRRDGVRLVTVSGVINVKDTSGASTRATKDLQALHLPAGVKLNTGGTSDDINSSFTSMFEAIGVAIALVFIILVAFFRSVVTPFVILVSMPLALIGALAALVVTHNALGLPALLGVLMVFGVVVSNAILLVDFTERARERLPVRDALMLAGSARLRPILMTAVATVVALLPVAAGISTSGGGGLISQSLAVVVEGGLITSTVFTLVVIPVVYSLIVRRSGRLRAAEEERRVA